MSTPPPPDPRDKVLVDYRRKAARPGLRPVLDADDPSDAKNVYLDYLHRRALARWLPGLGTRAIDLGCGIGRLTGMLMDAGLVVAVDNSPDLIALARERLGPAALLARGDLEDLPIASGSLTGALMGFVAMHFDDDVAARVFSEVARVLQPESRFLLFDHVSPDDEPRNYHGVVNRPLTGITALLDGAGFDVVRRIAVKKVPSRAVHWVKTGRLPRTLFRFGAFVDRMTVGRRHEHTDYIECLIVARRRGGSAAPLLPSAGTMIASLFLPPAWVDKRRPNR